MQIHRFLFSSFFSRPVNGKKCVNAHTAGKCTAMTFLKAKHLCVELTSQKYKTCLIVPIYSLFLNSLCRIKIKILCEKFHLTQDMSAKVGYFEIRCQIPFEIQDISNFKIDQSWSFYQVV